MENRQENQHRILVVDDEESMREFLCILLKRDGYLVDAVSDGQQAVACLKEQNYDLIISDIKMPRLDGFGLLDHVKERFASTAMIMITAFSTAEQAVDAMKKGAYDYITKPFKNEEIRLVVENALERMDLRRENLQLKKELGQRFSFANIIGKSKVMQGVYDLIEKVSASKVNVLITGESGTGKELVARAIHYNSDRHDRPFVAIYCGAIPENLLESELFGHEKGAFTGAVQQKQGLFEVADGGTLFLDEIAELPPMMQVKLLRVIQEHEFRKVGGTRDLKVDVRLVAATNKDLAQAVTEDQFREDLYYRLNVIQVGLPPLRDRREDIPLLVSHFLQKLTPGFSTTIPDGVMRRFLDYHWPGNIRELENTVERCVVLGGKGEITEDSLPPHMLCISGTGDQQLTELPEEGLDLDDYLGAIEKDILLKALDRTGGVRKRAAELLHITFRSIRYRLAKFGIEAEGGDERSGLGCDK